MLSVENLFQTSKQGAEQAAKKPAFRDPITIPYNNSAVS